MQKDKRFVVYTERMGLSHVSILMDRLTGVHYLHYFDGAAGGLTPLLGKDGKVVIARQEEEGTDDE